MSKRKFTAEFKAEIVLEVLRGERDLGAIASERQLNPNQIRAWKKAFLEKAPTMFEESRQEKEASRLKKEAADKEQAMLKTIGQLTLERDFLQQQAIERNRKGRLR